MNASTLTVPPGANHAPGGAACAETTFGQTHPLHHRGDLDCLGDTLDIVLGRHSRPFARRQAVERAAIGCHHCSGTGWIRRTGISTLGVELSEWISCPRCAGLGANGGYQRWLHHVQSAAGCTRPVRLAGDIVTYNRATDEVTWTSTDTMPDGALYKRCGNRRATSCPSCAALYRRDAYELIRLGLAGGRGVTADVAQHPALFVTLTAPSFGLVHTRAVSPVGKVKPCHARRVPQTCPHGRDLRCTNRHDETDPLLGQPLCLDCYDHNAQVVWNNQAGELWRRTTTAATKAIRRAAIALGIPPKTVRISVGKVAEMQRRGVVHYHAVIRLDGIDPFDLDAIVRPPDGLGHQQLEEAVRHAAAITHHTTDLHPVKANGWHIAWGKQIDVRRITVAGEGDLTDWRVAAYLAKYATKSTEATGHLANQLTADTIDLYADADGTHVERLVDAAWTLGRTRGWAKLRRWAHMLGFGGHFLTKTRRYSLTFRILRERRIIWTRTNHDDDQVPEPPTTAIVGLLTFIGAGWRTSGDALLANTAAALARERHQIGRQEYPHGP